MGGAFEATLTSAAAPDRRAAPAHRPLEGWPALTLWQRLGFLLAAIELVVLYGPTLLWLWERWTLSVWHHAHGLLIPPVVGYVIYQELRANRHLPAGASAWGFAIVAPALALRAIDAGLHTELLSAISLILLLPGLSLLVLGAARTRAILVPLAMLAFALPIPLALTEQVHWQLRLLAVAGTAAIVPLAGIPLSVDGTTLHLPMSTLEVADACSGFSTLYAAGAVACLTAYMTSDTRRRLLVLLAAAPVAIAANLARVVGLVLLTAWQGDWILGTIVHPLSGVFTFVLAMPVIFWIGGAGEAAPRTAARARAATRAA